MKNLLLVLGTVLLTGSAWAQSVQVEPYEPGEGIHINAPGKYEVRFIGFAQPMVESRVYPSMAEDNGPYQRFRMRRLVTKMTGTAAKEKIGYQVQVDLTGNSDAGGDGTTNNYLMDAWISYKATRNLEFVVGQENSPSDGREMGMLSNALQLSERNPVNLAFSSIREFGAIASYKTKLGSTAVIQPVVSVSNGDGANAFGKDQGGLKYSGRLDFLPFGLFSNGGQYRGVDVERELTPKLVFGLYGSINYGVSDRRGRESGSILYLDSAGHESLPNYTKFGFDLLAKYRGFTVYAEYVKATATVPNSIAFRVRQDGTTSSSFLINDIQDISGYVKGRMMVGSGFNIQAGYFFRQGYSLDARFSRLMPDQNSFLNNATFYNRSRYYTLCLSRYLGRNYGAKIQASVTYTKAEAGTLTLVGKPMKGNELSGILMMTIAI